MRSLVICALTLACATAAFAQGATTADTERALLDNERRVNDAVVKKDLNTFKSLVAPDAVVGDMSGFVGIAAFTKQLDQANISTWNMSDPRVVWANPDTAIVTYTWTGKGTWGGQPIPERMFASTVWTRRNEKWVAVFHQETAAQKN